MYSRPVLATDKHKTKFSWWEYWIEHCWMTGWQSIKDSFLIWGDLLKGDWEKYTLLPDDDPYTQCSLEFWYSLGADETLPRELLEHLMKVMEEVDNGEAEFIPFTPELFDQICSQEDSA